MVRANIRAQAVTVAWLLVLAMVTTEYTATAAAAAPPNRPIRLARAFELDELNIDNPAGVAFSPTAHAFHIVEAARRGRRAAGAAYIARVTPSERRLRSARIAALVKDPINITYDRRRRRLLSYAPTAGHLIEVSEGPGGTPDPGTLTRHDLGDLRIDDPQGMTVDPQTGDVFVLDSAAPRIVRISPARGGNLDAAQVADLDLRNAGLTDPVGLAFDPTTGHLHVVQPAEELLYELTATGAVVATRDLSGLDLTHPQGMVFAESGDLTDDPDQMSLYLADSGLEAGATPAPPVVSDVTPTSTVQPWDRDAARSTAQTETAAQSTGQLLELSFATAPSAPASAAGSTVSTLVQTINAFQWSPPSPDTSGVIYLPASDTLMASDGEVNETPLYAGANVFESTLTGNLLDTFTTLDFGNNEPTGISVNRANGHLFISQDTPPKLLYELDPGADGEYGTGDDDVTSLGTTDFGSTDPEGVTYDTTTGTLFIADGLNSEIYQLSPGPNGVFDGVSPSGDDQVVGQFDTFGLGMEDPEGIAHNPENNSLYIAGKTRNIGTRNFDTLLEVSTAGTLIRTIDVSAANPNREIPKQKLSGLAFAPSRQDPNARVVYIADRGEDNNNDPDENDGRIYEMTVESSSGSPVAPVAAGDSVTTVAGSAVTVDVAANDSDPDGNLDPASANSGCAGGSSGCAGAADGTLTDNGDGTITYTPDAGFVGSDSFLYEICDTTGLCDTATVDVTVNAAPGGSGGDVDFVSLDINTTVPGVGGVRDEDIVAYDAAAGTWAMYFDASDVGITSSDLDAVHVRADGSVLLSFSSTLTIPGLTGGPAGTSVDDTDVVRFTPTSTGNTTAGSFAFHFDGSDVGLDATSEDIDGLHEFADGSLGISTAGTLNVTGVAQGGDEDVHRFMGTFGAATAGSWSQIFDGSDVGLTASGDDLDGVSLPADADLLFSTRGSYTAAGGAGDDEDISRFTGTFGTTTSGTASLERDLSTLGIDPATDLDGLHVAR